MKKTLLFSFITILFTQSCDKKTEPRTAYIAQETKDFCVFQKGTWWEYENTRTNEIDTWKISESTLTINNSESLPYKKYEVVSMKIFSKKFDRFNFGGSIHGIGFSTTKNFGMSQRVYYEDPNERIGCDNNNLELVKSDTINKLCINKVFKMLPFPCTTYFPYHTKWERHKGITEMAYYNGDTLRLKSSNIIQ